MCSKNAQCASSFDDEYNLHECVCKAGFLGDGLTCDTDYSKKKLNLRIYAYQITHLPPKYYFLITDYWTTLTTASLTTENFTEPYTTSDGLTSDIETTLDSTDWLTTSESTLLLTTDDVTDEMSTTLEPSIAYKM